MTIHTLNSSPDSKLYFRLVKYLKPYKQRFTIGMLASIPAASLDSVVAWAIGPLLDNVLKTHDYSMLVYLPIIIIGANLISGVSFYLSTYCNNYVGTAISRDLRLELFDQLSKMDLGYFKKNSTGELYSRYVSDPGTLQAAIVNNLQDFVIQFASFIGLAIVLIYRNWVFALVAILVISSIFVPLQMISRKVRALDHDSNANLARMVSVFTEAINQAKLMISYQLSLYQRKRFEQALSQYFSTSMRIMKAGTWLKPMMQTIAACGISVIVVFGALQVQQGSMSPGELASFLVALILLYKPVKTIASILGKIQRILAPAERVFEKLDIESELHLPVDAVVPKIFNSLQFDHVYFEYDKGKLVLQDIHFGVKAGEIIALVGPSGGGKSTLVDLIPRFMDTTGGQILVNGTDIRKISLEWLRSQMAIVTQEPLLIDASIRENVMLGRLDASEADLRKALDAAHLTELLDTLPMGWDTKVGKNGTLLSGGQRQRVAIARAFLKDAPILILDEATSALDNESEAKVQDALMHIMQNRTVFVIAHRLSTIQCASRIMVINQGQVVETGTHAELLDMEGLYHKLYHLQFRYHDDLQSVSA